MVALMQSPNRFAVQRSERRMFPRKELRCEVDGRRMDHSILARREPRLKLSLRDVSAGGLSAFSDCPIEPGEHISVCFPASRVNRAWDAFGRVLRCTPGITGWQVAVEFDMLPAA
jgi:hypothetical protein